MVGEGFFGSSEKLLPSRPEPLHSFFSVAVGDEVSMMPSEFRHDLESKRRRVRLKGLLVDVAVQQEVRNRFTRAVVWLSLLGL